MILYDRGALVRVLQGAGFAAVQIEESPETLRAFAARSPEALAGLRPADTAAERIALRDYLAARTASAPPASALASGVAYRHFKECVNAGLYMEAAASRDRLARVYAERYNIDLIDLIDLKKADLDNPALDGGGLLPHNLTGALFFSGILELNALGHPDRAAACFASAVAVGRLLERQNPFNFADGETEALLAQSRKHLPMALAATEPDRAVREVEALERTALPGTLLAEARAQTFIRLINAGAFDAAERLAPEVAGQADRLADAGEASSETLDALYCLGLLALHRQRPDEAEKRFERLRRLATGSAASVWSARLLDALRRVRAGLAAIRA
jgi:hypothetical protein